MGARVPGNERSPQLGFNAMIQLAIHQSDLGFHPRWVSYCEQQGIPFKRVDCHANDIIEQLRDCHGLLWHHGQMTPADLVVAKAILSALEHTGFKVFPDWRTGWHFDDKVAQKYLMEAIGAPLVPTWVFLDRDSALDWVNSAKFPKVFKLRGGAGSSNVRLVAHRRDARKLVRRAFGAGFANYDAWGSLQERWRKFRLGKNGLFDVVKGAVRIFNRPPFARILGRELGYVYFQDFIPNNDSDTRVIVIGDKAGAMKRFVRENDFRASGSGHKTYDRTEIDERCVEIAFALTLRLNAQCAAYDFVLGPKNEPLLVEVSYGFVTEVYPGYWDRSMRWHEGPFNPQGCMVDVLVKTIDCADGGYG